MSKLNKQLKKKPKLSQRTRSIIAKVVVPKIKNSKEKNTPIKRQNEPNSNSILHNLNLKPGSIPITSNNKFDNFHLEIISDGWTPLHWAVSSGNLKKVIRLVESGADIYAKDKMGRTPMMLAFMENNLDIVAYLLKVHLMKINAYTPEIASMFKGKMTEEKLNFIYGCAILGKKNALRLRKKRGIVYFLRYSPKLLEYTMLQIDPDYKPKYITKADIERRKKAPKVVVVYNHADHNKAFYNNDISQLYKQGFDVQIYECGTENCVYNAITSEGKRGKIYAVIFGGHGSPKSIKYGKGEDEKNYIDITDKEMKKLNPYLAGATIILEACHSGETDGGKKNVATEILNTTGAKKVIAPIYAPITTRYVITKNSKEGRPVIKNVRYLGRYVKAKTFPQKIPEK